MLLTDLPVEMTEGYCIFALLCVAPFIIAIILALVAFFFIIIFAIKHLLK